MNAESLLNEFVRATRAILGEKLVGVYLHGSLAMGCFHPEKSDIDLLTVVNTPLVTDEKEKYIREILRLNEHAPEKGMEMSVVQAKYLKPFVHPAPYEMHFSNAHLDAYRRDLTGTLSYLAGTDRDLAAHVTIINHYGKALWGKAIGEVFSPVSHEDYLDALMYDIENAKEDIYENPVYTILSLCRVLAYAKDGKYVSKKDGGEWALENLPEALMMPVKTALNAYLTGEEAAFGYDLTGFAEEMLNCIRNAVSLGRNEDSNSIF